MDNITPTLTLAARGLLVMLRAGLSMSEIRTLTPSTAEDFIEQSQAALLELQDGGYLLDVAVVW